MKITIDFEHALVPYGDIEFGDACVSDGLVYVRIPCLQKDGSCNSYNAVMLGEGLVVLNVNTKVKKVTEIVVR